MRRARSTGRLCKSRRDFFRGIAIVGVVDHGLGGDAGALDDPCAGDDAGASLDIGTLGPVGDFGASRDGMLASPTVQGADHPSLTMRPSAAIRYTSAGRPMNPAS